MGQTCGIQILFVNVGKGLVDHDMRSKTSLEKQQRIDVAVSKLSRKRLCISSNTLTYTHSEIRAFFSSCYSAEYIDTIFNSRISDRHCGTCTFHADSADTSCQICGSSNLYTGKYLDNDTILTDVTRVAMQESAKVMMHIVDSNVRSAYALIRPPGHHSCRNQHEGFCTFNNAILMSKYIGNENILIVDWDVHHGNGTQKYVQDMPNVYYISLHHYDGVFYPKTGSIEENTDRILNVPFGKKIDNDEYLRLFTDHVIPFVDRISPCIHTIIVSNGLDAHRDDPLQIGCLTSEIYVKMTRYFKSKMKRIIFLLEGGYNEQVIANVSEDIVSEF